MSSRAAQTARDLPVEVKTFYVYMMTNRSRTVLYTGVTNSLERRIWFHRNHTVKSFTKIYKVDRLVHYEQFNEALDAIAREKEIKATRKEERFGPGAEPEMERSGAGTVRFWQRRGDKTGTMQVTHYEELCDRYSIARSLAVCAARDDKHLHRSPFFAGSPPATPYASTIGASPRIAGPLCTSVSAITSSVCVTRTTSSMVVFPSATRRQPS
jgi:putative endonuclease